LVELREHRGRRDEPRDERLAERAAERDAPLREPRSFSRVVDSSQNRRLLEKRVHEHLRGVRAEPVQRRHRTRRARRALHPAGARRAFQEARRGVPPVLGPRHLAQLPHAPAHRVVAARRERGRAFRVLRDIRAVAARRLRRGDAGRRRAPLAAEPVDHERDVRARRVAARLAARRHRRRAAREHRRVHQLALPGLQARGAHRLAPEEHVQERVGAPRGIPAPREVPPARLQQRARRVQRAPRERVDAFFEKVKRPFGVERAELHQLAHEPHRAETTLLRLARRDTITE